MNHESDYQHDRLSRLFTPEHAKLAESVSVGKKDLDAYMAVLGEGDSLNVTRTRSRLIWNGLSRCYWYSSHKDPMGDTQPTPKLPDNPLAFEGTGNGLSDSDNWRLNLGSTMKLLNSYHAYRYQHPEMGQVEILGRHMWQVSLDNVNDLCVELFEALCEADEAKSN